MLYLIVVLYLFEVGWLWGLMSWCGIYIGLILGWRGHVKLQLILIIRWPHRITIRLKSDLIELIWHAWSCAPMISFSSDCRLCKQICWKFFRGILLWICKILQVKWLVWRHRCKMHLLIIIARYLINRGLFLLKLLHFFESI